MNEKIIALIEKRFAYFEKNNSDSYQGHETFIRSLHEEINEAVEEIADDNQVYLEDELGDVLWVYLCLLESLKAEGKISSTEKVLARCYEKFSERINPETGANNSSWEAVKKVQKQKRKIEHNKKYNEKAHNNRKSK